MDASESGNSGEVGEEIEGEVSSTCEEAVPRGERGATATAVGAAGCSAAEDGLAIADDEDDVDEAALEDDEDEVVSLSEDLGSLPGISVSELGGDGEIISLEDNVLISTTEGGYAVLNWGGEEIVEMSSSEPFELEQDLAESVSSAAQEGGDGDEDGILVGEIADDDDEDEDEDEDDDDELEEVLELEEEELEEVERTISVPDGIPVDNSISQVPHRPLPGGADSTSGGLLAGMTVTTGGAGVREENENEVTTTEEEEMRLMSSPLSSTSPSSITTSTSAQMPSTSTVTMVATSNIASPSGVTGVSASVTSPSAGATSPAGRGPFSPQNSGISSSGSGNDHSGRLNRQTAVSPQRTGDGVSSSRDKRQAASPAESGIDTTSAFVHPAPNAAGQSSGVSSASDAAGNRNRAVRTATVSDSTVTGIIGRQRGPQASSSSSDDSSASSEAQAMRPEQVPSAPSQLSSGPGNTVQRPSLQPGREALSSSVVSCSTSKPSSAQGSFPTSRGSDSSSKASVSTSNSNSASPQTPITASTSEAAIKEPVRETSKPEAERSSSITSPKHIAASPSCSSSNSSLASTGTSAGKPTPPPPPANLKPPQKIISSTSNTSVESSSKIVTPAKEKVAASSATGKPTSAVAPAVAASTSPSSGRPVMPSTSSDQPFAGNPPIRVSKPVGGSGSSAPQKLNPPPGSAVAPKPQNVGPSGSQKPAVRLSGVPTKPVPPSGSGPSKTPVQSAGSSLSPTGNTGMPVEKVPGAVSSKPPSTSLASNPVKEVPQVKGKPSISSSSTVKQEASDQKGTNPEQQNTDPKKPGQVVRSSPSVSGVAQSQGSALTSSVQSKQAPTTEIKSLPGQNIKDASSCSGDDENGKKFSSNKPAESTSESNITRITAEAHQSGTKQEANASKLAAANSSKAEPQTNLLVAPTKPVLHTPQSAKTTSPNPARSSVPQNPISALAQQKSVANPQAQKSIGQQQPSKQAQSFSKPSQPPPAQKTGAPPPATSNVQKQFVQGQDGKPVPQPQSTKVSTQAASPKPVQGASESSKDQSKLENQGQVGKVLPQAVSKTPGPTPAPKPTELPRTGTTPGSVGQKPMALSSNQSTKQEPHPQVKRTSHPRPLQGQTFVAQPTTQSQAPKPGTQTQPQKAQCGSQVQDGSMKPPDPPKPLAKPSHLPQRSISTGSPSTSIASLPGTKTTATPITRPTTPGQSESRPSSTLSQNLSQSPRPSTPSSLRGSSPSPTRAGVLSPPLSRQSTPDAQRSPTSPVRTVSPSLTGGAPRTATSVRSPGPTTPVSNVVSPPLKPVEQMKSHTSDKMEMASSINKSDASPKQDSMVQKPTTSGRSPDSIIATSKLVNVDSKGSDQVSKSPTVQKPDNTSESALKPVSTISQSSQIIKSNLQSSGSSTGGPTKKTDGLSGRKVESTAATASEQKTFISASTTIPKAVDTGHSVQKPPTASVPAQKPADPSEEPQKPTPDVPMQKVTGVGVLGQKPVSALTQKPTGPGIPAQKSAPSAASVQKPLGPVESVHKPAGVPVTMQKPGAPTVSTIATAPSQKPSATTTTGQKPSGLTASMQKPTGTTTPAQKPAGITTPAQKSAGPTAPAQKPPGATAPAQKPAGASTPVQKTAGITAPAQKLAGTSTPVQKPAGTTAPVQKPAGTTAPVQKPAGTTAPVQKPAGTTAPVQKPAGTTTPVQKPVGTSTPVQKPAGTTAPVQKPAGTTASVQKPAGTTAPVQKPAGTSTPVQKPAGTTAPAQKPSGTTGPVQKPAGASTPVQKPSGASTPVQKPAGPPTPMQKLSGASTPVQKSAGAPTPMQKPASTTAPLQKPSGASTPAQKPPGPNAPPQKLAGSAAPPQKPAGMTAPLQKPAGATADTQKPTSVTAPTQKLSGALAPTQKPAGATPPAQKPAGATPPAQKPAGATPTAQKPAGATPPAQKPGGATPPAQKSAGATPAAQKPAAATTPAQKPAGVTPLAQKPAGATPPAQKPAGATPSAQKSAGATPAAQKPAGVTPPVQKPAGATASTLKPTGASVPTPKPESSAGSAQKPADLAAPVPKPATTVTKPGTSLEAASKPTAPAEPAQKTTGPEAVHKLTGTPVAKALSGSESMQKPQGPGESVKKVDDSGVPEPKLGGPDLPFMKPGSSSEVTKKSEVALKKPLVADVSVKKSEVLEKKLGVAPLKPTGQGESAKIGGSPVAPATKPVGLDESVKRGGDTAVFVEKPVSVAMEKLEIPTAKIEGSSITSLKPINPSVALTKPDSQNLPTAKPPGEGLSKEKLADASEQKLGISSSSVKKAADVSEPSQKSKSPDGSVPEHKAKDASIPKPTDAPEIKPGDQKIPLQKPDGKNIPVQKPVPAVVVKQASVQKQTKPFQKADVSGVSEQKQVGEETSAVVKKAEDRLNISSDKQNISQNLPLKKDESEMPVRSEPSIQPVSYQGSSTENKTQHSANVPEIQKDIHRKQELIPDSNQSLRKTDVSDVSKTLKEAINLEEKVSESPKTLVDKIGEASKKEKLPSQPEKITKSESIPRIVNVSSLSQYPTSDVSGFPTQMKKESDLKQSSTTIGSSKETVLSSAELKAIVKVTAQQLETKKPVLIEETEQTSAQQKCVQKSSLGKISPEAAIIHTSKEIPGKGDTVTAKEPDHSLGQGTIGVSAVESLVCKRSSTLEQSKVTALSGVVSVKTVPQSGKSQAFGKSDVTQKESIEEKKNVTDSSHEVSVTESGDLEGPAEKSQSEPTKLVSSSLIQRTPGGKLGIVGRPPIGQRPVTSERKLPALEKITSPMLEAQKEKTLEKPSHEDVKIQSETGKLLTEKESVKLEQSQKSLDVKQETAVSAETTKAGRVSTEVVKKATTSVDEKVKLGGADVAILPTESSSKKIVQASPETGKVVSVGLKEGEDKVPLKSSVTVSPKLPTTVSPAESSDSRMKLPKTSDEKPEERTSSMEESKKIPQSSEAVAKGLLSPIEGPKHQEVSSSNISLGSSTKAASVKSPLTIKVDDHAVSGPRLSPITLKLRKDSDGKGDEYISLSPKLDSSRETEKLTLKLKRVGSPTVRELESEDKFTVKLKKESGRTDSSVSSTTATACSSSFGETASKTEDSEPKVGKLMLKLKDTDKGIVARISKSGDGQKSDIEEEQKVEKLTLKLKKESMETGQHSPSISSKTDDVPKVEKLTLKLRVDSPSLQETAADSDEPKVEKLMLKLRKDSTEMLSPKEKDSLPSPKQDKLTLRIRKDSGSTEVSAGDVKKFDTGGESESSERITLTLVKDSSNSVSVKEKDSHDTKSSEEKVEKLTLKLKKDPSTSKDVSSVQSFVSGEKLEQKVEKLTLKLKSGGEDSLVGREESLIKDNMEKVSAKLRELEGRGDEPRVEKLTLKLKKEDSEIQEVAVIDKATGSEKFSLDARKLTLKSPSWTVTSPSPSVAAAREDALLSTLQADVSSPPPPSKRLRTASSDGGTPGAGSASARSHRQREEMLARLPTTEVSVSLKRHDVAPEGGRASPIKKMKMEEKLQECSVVVQEVCLPGKSPRLRSPPPPLSITKSPPPAGGGAPSPSPSSLPKSPPPPHPLSPSVSLAKASAVPPGVGASKSPPPAQQHQASSSSTSSRALDGKLREILSKIGGKASALLDCDVSISFASQSPEKSGGSSAAAAVAAAAAAAAAPSGSERVSCERGESEEVEIIMVPGGGGRGRGRPRGRGHSLRGAHAQMYRSASHQSPQQLVVEPDFINIEPVITLDTGEGPAHPLGGPGGLMRRKSRGRPRKAETAGAPRAIPPALASLSPAAAAAAAALTSQLEVKVVPLSMPQQQAGAASALAHRGPPPPAPPPLPPGAPMPPMHPLRPKRPCRGRERPFVEPKKPRGGGAGRGRGGRKKELLGSPMGAGGGGSLITGGGEAEADALAAAAEAAAAAAMRARAVKAAAEAAVLASAEAALAAAAPPDASGAPQVSVFAVPPQSSGGQQASGSPSIPPKDASLIQGMGTSPRVTPSDMRQPVTPSGTASAPAAGARSPSTPSTPRRLSAAAARKARAAAASAARVQALAAARAARQPKGPLHGQDPTQPGGDGFDRADDTVLNLESTTPGSCFFPSASSSPLTVFGKSSIPTGGTDLKDGDEDGVQSGATSTTTSSPAPPVVLLDEETRMSADISITEGSVSTVEGDSRPPSPSRSLLPPSAPAQQTARSGDGNAMEVEELVEMDERARANNAAAPTAAPVPAMGEESQGSGVSSATGDSGTPGVRRNKCRMEVCDPDAKEFSVDMLAEYQWPPGRSGEPLMLQEQVAEYLGVKSFKRKYPDLQRRAVEAEEKTYLREKGLVSDNLSDMGLTAISSVEVLDIMFADFPEKYEEYRKHLRERQAKEMSLKQKLIAVTSNAERSRLDYKERAASSAASWNAKFNRARREQRRACFDLQNLTVHFPASRVKKMTRDVPKLGHYPIALIPGQFTDYYKEYTPAELRYFPLNTVLYGPMKPNERQESVAGSEGSQSDSDDSSSSDESSSSSSSEGTQDTEETGSTAGDAENADGAAGAGPTKDGTGPTNEGPQGSQMNGRAMVLGGGHSGERMPVKDDATAICKICGGDRNRNKESKPEVLIHCATCTSSCHPSCLDLTLDMVPHIRKYDWQCTDCKTCIQCKDPADEDKMLFCDMCDRGYHIYCVGLRRVPSGRWHCRECAVCGSCGSREPGPGPDAQWQHEYKKGTFGAAVDNKGGTPNRVYAQTLCIACSKLWRRGRYCQLCWRCFDAKTDDDTGLITCSVCDKMMHPECCSAVGGVELDRTNFLCEICQEKGHQGRASSLKLSMRPVVKV